MSNVRGGLSAALVIVGCLAALPASAPAATVGRQVKTLEFDAASGETNRLTVSTPSASEYRFEDVAAPLRAGAGCRATPDVHVVLCRIASGPQENTGFRVELRDRDDAFQHAGGQIEPLGFNPLVLVRGGSGDDRLSGGKIDDDLFGDRGADVVLGGGGSDRLEGGAGRDRVSGGAGDDSLFGAGAADRLSGGRGFDRLHGGSGANRLDGGPGNDEFEAGEGGRDLIRGGRGIDSVLWTLFPRSRGRLGFRFFPRIEITFDGRANDGPPSERDNVARDVERARTERPFRTRGRHPGGVVRGALVSAASGPSVRTIFRLSGRGTAGAEKGVFVGPKDANVREGRSRSSPTEVSLPTTGFAECGAGSSRARARLSRRTIHRLRARARGRFRTRGRYSAATVRGTNWTVADRCDGTLTKVSRGRLRVRDLRRRKTILLRSGQSYLAQPPS